MIHQVNFFSPVYAQIHPIALLTHAVAMTTFAAPETTAAMSHDVLRFQRQKLVCKALTADSLAIDRLSLTVHGLMTLLASAALRQRTGRQARHHGANTPRAKASRATSDGGLLH